MENSPIIMIMMIVNVDVMMWSGSMVSYVKLSAVVCHRLFEKNSA